MDCVVVKRGGGARDHRAPAAPAGRAGGHGRGGGRQRGHRGLRPGVPGGGHGANEFRFMSTEVSRERPVNYEELAARLGEEKRRGGYLVWVVGTGAGPFAGPGRLRVVHPERVRPGGARRERGRRARHRGGDLRHHARHDQHRPAHRRRPRAPHARHQPGARRGLDRARGGDRGHHERHHARAGDQPGALRAGRLDPRRRPAARRVQRHAGGPGRDAGAHRARPPGRSSSPPRSTPSRSATCSRPSSLRRRPGAAHDHLRGPDRVRRQQAEGPRHPPGLRRGHQRPGLHARAALLYRAMGAGAR